MNKENTLECFIIMYMRFQITDSNLKLVLKRVTNTDACQTKIFYINLYNRSKDQQAFNVLRQIICPDEEVIKNIEYNDVFDKRMKKCLEMLFVHSKGCESTSHH